MNEEKKSIIKSPIVWVIIAALLLCVITVFTFSNVGNTFKLTYKGNTITYKVEEMHSHTMDKRDYEVNGEMVPLKEGEYIDINEDLFKAVPIWNYTKITYVQKDGTKIEFDSDVFYHEGTGLLLPDELRIEEDFTVTVIHYDNTITEEHDFIIHEIVEYENVVEIIVDSPNYK